MKPSVQNVPQMYSTCSLLKVLQSQTDEHIHSFKSGAIVVKIAGPYCMS